ncbi:hypothetical protein HQ585_03145 [candidate division KSB1 bacterium]|nr:hypothetical protein [candidate division KSB1 bacterium]
MKKWLSLKLAGNTMIFIMGLFAVLHLLILLGLVPSDMVWGGQINESAGNIVVLEGIALIVTSLIIFIVVIKLGYVYSMKPTKITRMSLWIIFIYFILNTIGNLTSGVTVENIIFAPITIILALCAFRLAIDS